MTEWEAAGIGHGWTMPAAAWWKRLPIVRHLRALAGAYMVERWYAAGPGSIGLRTGYDEWVLAGIWQGKERAL